ncbi:uncharacterized protein TNCT_658511 [Trichonephila clavata]|uniref:Uncharacterized protein n=1 Tax=Trichonephila clavata TaxID=2740835 RepID=A0A8X6J6Q0_TRICU|nr:uncharacterized protein TNCT_658511 [Trichonephila clavata]
MLSIALLTLQLVRLVTSSKIDSSRYFIDSKPFYSQSESNADTDIINSTQFLKKKASLGGPIYYNSWKPEFTVSNHHVPSRDGTVWKQPEAPLSIVISNHKGNTLWNHKWFQKLASTTAIPQKMNTPDSFSQDALVINNHKSNKLPNSRPHHSSSVVTVSDTTPTRQTATDVLGDRLKLPDVVKSATLNILDAPSNLKTTIKHNKIIVIQKRTDTLTQNHVENGSKVNSGKPNKLPQLGNFSVAPVMDPWSNIPIPSRPSWAAAPVKGGVSQPSQTVLPNLPFMPFLSSLIMPLMSKPLSPSALNSGMQGIKAMQRFLRNSLMGAMFCFLPSAFIALSLTATQRTDSRQVPDLDDIKIICKKCLENLNKVQDLTHINETSWLNEDSR